MHFIYIFNILFKGEVNDGIKREILIVSQKFIYIQFNARCKDKMVKSLFRIIKAAYNIASFTATVVRL